MSQNPNCPKCESKMKLRIRKSDGNQFWGCSQFPKCKGTRPYIQNNDRQLEKRELKSIPNPSKYQKDIFDGVVSLCENGEYNEHEHLIVSAGPGTGKTATQEHIVGIIKKHSSMASIVYLVFNAHVQREAASKGLPALTTHGKFFSDWREYRKGHKIKVDDRKVYLIVKELLNDTIDEDKWMISIVCQLVSKVKNTCAPTDDSTLNKLCERFNIETNGSSDRIFELTRLALDENNKQLDLIDFDDMLYLPWKFKIPIRQYDFVLGDEVQDWNRVQIELIERATKKHTIVVGDRNQSIYGFRGADLNSMDNLKTRFDAYEMPLSISYRCAKSHVALLNALFPHISLESFEGAKEGTIEEMSVNRMMGEVRDNDLVLCRTNAPLVKPCFSLIRRGQKAIIRGRDIGQNLINLVEKHESSTLDNTLRQLQDYGEREVAKLLRLERNSQAASLEDKVETIFAISDNCKEVWELKKRIEEIFSDDKVGVVFSSIHKAKGDEADNVFILEPQLMPHRMAEKDWELQQEQNIIWVALSRSKDRMVFVGGPAPTTFGEWTEEDDKIADEVIEKLDVKKVDRNIEFELKIDEKEIQIIAQQTPKEHKEKIGQYSELIGQEAKGTIEVYNPIKEIPECPF